MARSPLPIALMLLLAGCATAPAPAIVPARVLPQPQAVAAQAAPVAAAPRVSVEQGPAEAADPLAVYRRLEGKGGIVKDFTGDIARAETGYGVLVVPSDSEEKALKTAQEWAPDARPIFVGYGFWKKQFISFVRHGFYSKQKDRALMLDFAISRHALIHKSDEDGDTYRDVAAALGDASDNNKYTAKLATEIAKANGYFPKKFHVAALVNMALFGSQWVFLNDEDWTPEMLINAKTGSVTKTGPMMEAAKLLIQSTKRPSPSPSVPPEDGDPTPEPKPSATDASPTPTPSPSSFLPF